MSKSKNNNEVYVVHNLLNSMYNLCKMTFEEDVILFYLDEDIEKSGYGTVLKEDILEVIRNGNVREQLTILSKFFSSWKDKKINFLAGSCFRDIYDNRKNLKNVLKFNFELLEEEHKLIPLIHRANGVVLYDRLKGSYYLSFDKYGFVYKQKQLENKIKRSDEEMEAWDNENYHLPYLFDPPLSEREFKFLDKIQNKVLNVNERKYSNMASQESGIAYTFAKLGIYFNLTSEEMDMLQNEVVAWLIQTRNHPNEDCIKKSFQDCVSMEELKAFL